METAHLKQIRDDFFGFHRNIVPFRGVERQFVDTSALRMREGGMADLDRNQTADIHTAKCT